MENHKDDILKKFLQDTFSDYEPEPSEASWETIFSAIQPNQPTFWDKSKPWIASVLVILTSAWFWYSSAKVEANNAEIALESLQVGTLATDENLLMKTSVKAGNKKQSDDSQTDKAYQLENKLINSSDYRLTNKKHLKDIQMDKNIHLNNIQTVQIIENQIITENAKNVVKSKNANKLAKYREEIIVKSETPKEEGENHPTVEKQLDETVFPMNNLIASTSGRVETFATNVNVRGQVEALATDANTVIEQVRYIRPLESLRNKDFTLAKIALNFPVITPVIIPNREVKPVRQHTYLSMSIMPIQTYRILKINNNYVQNVQTNDLFDSERNGWDLNLGVIKPIGKLWNFRANLSYLRMRQWSEYQIGTYELILRNNNNSNTGNKSSKPSQGVSPEEIEVVGQTVTESKNLHMIGLKMDVQKFFKITPKNHYFISTGTQVMYENSQQQSNIFLNVSAGFQHIVSKTTFLTIEPTASYGLNNFNDSKSLLQANGYNLGLKMGVSFKVK